MFAAIKSHIHQILQGVPSNAIRDRAGDAIKDRATAYIQTR